MLDLSFLAAAAEAAGHAEEPSFLGMGPGGWVAASMLAVFALMLWAGVPRIVAGLLDKRIAEIKGQLDEAARLRAEAEALRAEYQAKVADAAAHADALKAHAQDEAKAIVAKARDDAEALVARREKLAEDKIGAAERGAIEELRAKAADAAAAAARTLIAESHDAKADQPLVEKAIAGI